MSVAPLQIPNALQRLTHSADGTLVSQHVSPSGELSHSHAPLQPFIVVLARIACGLGPDHTCRLQLTVVFVASQLPLMMMAMSAGEKGHQGIKQYYIACGVKEDKLVRAYTQRAEACIVAL